MLATDWAAKYEHDGSGYRGLVVRDRWGSAERIHAGFTRGTVAEALEDAAELVPAEHRSKPRMEKGAPW